MKPILRSFGVSLVAVLILLGISGQRARADFSIQTDSSNEVKMYLDPGSNVSSVTGHVGSQGSTDTVTITTIGTVDAASGWATITPYGTGSLTQLIFTPGNPNLFNDFDFRGQLVADGTITVTVQDNQGDSAQTFSFSGNHNADLGPFGIVGSGETIKSVTLSFTGDSSSDSFNEVKQIDFSYATPAPVPIPGAVWLLGSGLIGLAGIRRKRRA